MHFTELKTLNCEGDMQCNTRRCILSTQAWFSICHGLNRKSHHEGL